MKIEKLVDAYVAPVIAAKIVKSTKIVLLVGISGAGKDTIKKQLLDGSDYMDIVSHTTRAMRSNDGIKEKNGIDYSFIDMARAEQMLKNHEFIEAKYVHGTIYGTSIAAVKQARDSARIAVTDIDVQGVAEYKDISQDVMAIFILPPDFSVWRQRLRSRYVTAEDFELEWPKRRKSAIKELTHALEVPYYHFIINDELDRAVRVVNEISHRGDAFNRQDDEARILARNLLDAITNAD